MFGTSAFSPLAKSSKTTPGLGDKHDFHLKSGWRVMWEKRTQLNRTNFFRQMDF